MRRAIHWFRRDLRLHDNTALRKAVEQAESVVPVFVVEDAFQTGPDVGAARAAFLFKSVSELDASLDALGQKLIIRYGRSDVEIPKLAQELKAQAVFCNKRYEPYAQARDRRVFNALNSVGVGFELFKDAVIWEEREILTKTQQLYTVFTPYANAWRSKNFAAPPRNIRKIAPCSVEVASHHLPTVDHFGLKLSQSIPNAGEKAGLRLLDEFIRGKLFHYGDQRDFPAIQGTSQLSPHLRAGTVSIRKVVSDVLRARAKGNPKQKNNCDTFLNELIWREFYLQILHHFPHVMKGNFRREYDSLEWSHNESHFAAWKEGQTGYPIVDAAMRCLNATGWMHNRLRMIVAMFLTKDLLLNWQWGERYFMQQLVDGDLAANNGGWQWSAGTGTDAAPYFRIFNPVTQGMKFDPKGEFIRAWIPELTDLPNQLVHEPWEAGLLAARYPVRIVLHKDQRAKALDIYARIKSSRTSPREP